MLKCAEVTKSRNKTHGHIPLNIFVSDIAVKKINKM